MMNSKKLLASEKYTIKNCFFYKIFSTPIDDWIELSEDTPVLEIKKKIFADNQSALQALGADGFLSLELGNRTEVIKDDTIVKIEAISSLSSPEFPVKVYPRALKDGVKVLEEKVLKEQKERVAMIKKEVEEAEETKTKRLNEEAKKREEEAKDLKLSSPISQVSEKGITRIVYEEGMQAEIKSAIATGLPVGYFDPKEIEDRSKKCIEMEAERCMSLGNEAAVHRVVGDIIQRALFTQAKNEYVNSIEVQDEFTIDVKYGKSYSCRADMTIVKIGTKTALILTEVKKDGIDEAILQNFQQLRAYATRFNQDTMYGIASNYHEWVVTCYKCARSSKGWTEDVSVSAKCFIKKYKQESVAEMSEVITTIRAAVVLALRAQKIDLDK